MLQSGLGCSGKAILMRKEVGKLSIILYKHIQKVKEKGKNDQRVILDYFYNFFSDISQSFFDEIMLEKLKIACKIDTQNIQPCTPSKSHFYCVQIFELIWLRNHQPSYLSNLAPSDFHLFTKLKTFLGGKHYSNDDEVKQWRKD